MRSTTLYSAIAAGFALNAGFLGGAHACDLEIAPGATIAGASSEDFIVIEQDCRILAEGTVDQPIVFTGIDAVMGEVEDNVRGLWGGLVINGRAPINDCPEGADGGTA